MSKLSEISLMITKGTTPSTIGKKFEKTGVRFVKAENIISKYLDLDDTEYISEETHKLLKKSQIQENDLLFTIAGYLGRISIVRKEDLPLNTNQAVAIIRLDETKVNPHYVYYYLKQTHINKYINGLSAQSAQPNLNLALLGKIDIPMIPMYEQNRIVQILSQIDCKIYNNNLINAQLKLLSKTIYDYWFLQFEFPNEEGKPYKSSGGKMIWNEELKREIPEGWNAKLMVKCIEHIKTGLNPRKNFKLNNGGNIKYITVKNITKDGKLDFTGCDYIDEDARNIVHNRSDVNINDILFASIAPLGRCYLVLDKPNDWDINESVFSIRPNLKNITSEYLYMFLTSDYFVKKSEHESTGSVFNGIRITNLENMLLLLPSKEILFKFSNIAKKLFNERNEIEKQNQQLESLRDFLLPLLMNGQVTFKKDDENA